MVTNSGSDAGQMLAGEFLKSNRIATSSCGESSNGNSPGRWSQQAVSGRAFGYALRSARIRRTRLASRCGLRVYGAK